MDYAQGAINTYNQLQNAVPGGMIGGQAAPPRTITSAASRLDELNARLSKATEGLGMIANQLGALSGVNGAAVKERPIASGAVHRLNESADDAHMKLSEIEALIAGIGRALG